MCNCSFLSVNFRYTEHYNDSLTYLCVGAAVFADHAEPEKGVSEERGRAHVHTAGACEERHEVATYEPHVMVLGKPRNLDRAAG